MSKTEPIPPELKVDDIIDPPVTEDEPAVIVLLFDVIVVHDNAPPVIEPVPDVKVLLFVLIVLVVNGRLILIV